LLIDTDYYLTLPFSFLGSTKSKFENIEINSILENMDGDIDITGE